MALIMSNRPHIDIPGVDALIRIAQPDDAKAIAGVHVRSWQQAYADLLPADYLHSLDSTVGQREAWWRQSIEEAKEQVFVALIDEVIVGWVSFGASRDEDVEPQRAGEIRAIYILAEYWGSGIGRELWSAAIKSLAKQRYECVTLWVLAGNHRAIGFYSRAGLEPEIESKRSIVRGGQPLEEIRYQLTL